MLRDAQHFASRISKLEGSGDLGEAILAAAAEKKLPVTDAPAPAAVANTETESKTNVVDPPLPPTPVVEISGILPNPQLPISPDEVVAEPANGDVVANGVVEGG